MPFDPLKNRKLSEPDIIQEETAFSDADNIINYEANPMPQAPSGNSLSYEGTQVSELQQAGINTESALNSTRPVEKQKTNYKVLDILPLDKVLLGLGATSDKTNLFSVFGQSISLKEQSSLKEQKWFNKTAKKGHINALSLVKHLIAIRDNKDEINEQKNLFVAACKQLSIIKNTLDNASLEPVKATPEVSPVASNVDVIAPVDVVTQAPQNVKPKKDWKAFYKEMDSQINSIPLDEVLEELGANSNEDGQATKWKLWDTSDNLNVTGQLWNTWNDKGGGYGGLSLVEFYMAKTQNIDAEEGDNWKTVKSMARTWFLEHFKSEIDNNEYKDHESVQNLSVPFSMPHVIDFKINQVRNYLHEKRGIPVWIINKQISKGHLFAGYPSDWPNPPKNLHDPLTLSDNDVWATFLSANGSAAEMRGIARTDNLAKIMAKGSVKEAGGFVIKAEKDCSERTITALEASVDSLSYHSFYPGRATISCMGVTFSLAAKAALDALDNDGKFNLAFDNDRAGNYAAVSFKNEMINELGEQEYQTYVQEQKIKYFDLGIRCLKEQIELGQPYYLDVNSDAEGREAAIMFQEQLFQVMEKSEVKHLIQQGLIKYANICPDFNLIKNAEHEAQNVISLLNSDKPYYLRIDNEADENPRLKEKREAFEKCFNEFAKDKKAQWEQEGKIIYEKHGIAKDWNEYFIYMQKKPQFKAYLKEQEEHYSHYNDTKAPVIQNQKLGLNKKLKH